MQLNEYVANFKTIGVEVVAISYDSHRQNATFKDEHRIQYPILSDQAGKTVREFGILNETYGKGHPAHGIPHPGIIYVHPDATIGLKRAIRDYKKRPELVELLEAVKRTALAS